MRLRFILNKPSLSLSLSLSYECMDAYSPIHTCQLAHMHPHTHPHTHTLTHFNNIEAFVPLTAFIVKYFAQGLGILEILCF